jgi:hypothetical protein
MLAGGSRVLSTMYRWTGSGEDKLRPQLDASPVKDQTHRLVGDDLVFDVATLKMNAATGAPSSPLTLPGDHGLGRTSRQDAVLDESTKLCADRRLGDRNVAILATSADGESHPATHPDGPLAKPHTRFTCSANPSVQVGGCEAGGLRPAHRCHEIHQGEHSCRSLGRQEGLRALGTPARGTTSRSRAQARRSHHGDNRAAAVDDALVSV